MRVGRKGKVFLSNTTVSGDFIENPKGLTLPCVDRSINWPIEKGKMECGKESKCMM